MSRKRQTQILAKARAARAFQSGGTEALISYAKANSPINRAVARVMGAPR